MRLLDVSEIEDLEEAVDLELNEDQDELLLEIELADLELGDDLDCGVELEEVFSQYVLDVLVEELELEELLELLQITIVLWDDVLLLD